LLLGERCPLGEHASLTDVTDDDRDEAELTVDGLTRDWKITQRKRGHRHSTDDLLTAWYAVEHLAFADGARRVLDLGSGIGSVGLLVLWRSPHAMLTAIEAQDVSFRLLEKNIAMNGLADRVRAIHGDLRTVRLEGESFDLVTGSPPYFDVKAGIVPADTQKAHARFELRGDVRDYCRAARDAMAPGARFVFCFPTVQRERAERACDDMRLARVTSRDVVPRRGAPALFSLFACRRSEDAPHAPAILEPPYIVRDEAGVETMEHAAARATFGMGC
jgi:tRNA1Val (adenine37-N6)-methyltransferase